MKIIVKTIKYLYNKIVVLFHDKGLQFIPKYGIIIFVSC